MRDLTSTHSQAAYNAGIAGGIVLDVAIGGGIAKQALSKSRVFWSGGNKAKNAAESWAMANNSVTLEMTRAGKKLVERTKNMDWREAKQLWKAASGKFADDASGTVQVFRNLKKYRRNSIWGKVERPILKKNKTKIKYNDFHSK